MAYIGQETNPRRSQFSVFTQLDGGAATADDVIAPTGSAANLVVKGMSFQFLQGNAVTISLGFDDGSARRIFFAHTAGASAVVQQFYLPDLHLVSGPGEGISILTSSSTAVVNLTLWGYYDTGIDGPLHTVAT